MWQAIALVEAAVLAAILVAAVVMAIRWRRRQKPENVWLQGGPLAPSSPPTREDSQYVATAEHRPITPQPPATADRFIPISPFALGKDFDVVSTPRSALGPTPDPDVDPDATDY